MKVIPLVACYHEYDYYMRLDLEIMKTVNSMICVLQQRDAEFISREGVIKMLMEGFGDIYRTHVIWEKEKHKY